MADNRHRALHGQGDFTSQYEESERKQGKTLCVLAYIPLFCLVTLFLARTRYLRFHANQGLSLFITMLVTNAVIIALGWLLGLAFSILASVFYLLALLVDLAFRALALIGVYHALTERAQELPLLGEARILK